MNNIYPELNKTIEKIINLRINEIIEKCNFNEETNNKIKDINDIISKDNKNKGLKNGIKKTNSIKKEDKKLSIYAIFVKDTNRIIKNENHLNYLNDNTIIEIKNLKDKNKKDQFKELGSIWKNLDNNIINKYKELTSDKNFTNEKYDKIVNIKSPKLTRKKKI